MAGRMGHTKATKQNLKIVEVDSVNNKLEVFKKEPWDLREPVYKDNISNN